MAGQCRIICNNYKYNNNYTVKLRSIFFPCKSFLRSFSLHALNISCSAKNFRELWKNELPDKWAGDSPICELQFSQMSIRRIFLWQRTPSKVKTQSENIVAGYCGAIFSVEQYQHQKKFYRQVFDVIPVPVLSVYTTF